jgi:murein L,D-transpeptidase YcbB/YkuD
MVSSKMKNTLLYFFLAVSYYSFSINEEKKILMCSRGLFYIDLTQKKNVSEFPIDSLAIVNFFRNYPKLKGWESQVFEVYRTNHNQSVWFAKNRINELGILLHQNTGNLFEDGLQIKVPYKEKLDVFFSQFEKEHFPDIEIELLLTSVYFFYTQHVFHGIDDKSTADLGWFIPRKKQTFVTYLDTLIRNPKLLSHDESKMFKQYYRLKDALKKYRLIEAKGKWQPIVMANSNPIAVGTKSSVILKVRERLHFLGFLKVNNKSMEYDKELEQAVWKYKKNMGITIDDLITPRLISSLNVPIADRIKSIIFNMERCRWISSDFNQSKEFIFINIPSYEMNYFKEGKTLLNSKVVVGKIMNQTVIFSGMLKYVVFSPYWNVPKSIVDKEIMPAIKKNKNYLAQHNMEWNDVNIRQRPGPKNSLGLVKFLFPNSNSIYLHDTPSKSLFKEEKRAFSHGCIRLEKPIELAYLLVKDDKYWTMEKLNNALHSKKEIWYTLKQEIPVYIGYFTAWVNEYDEVQFYDDVYARDECLTSYLFSEQ